MIWSNWEILVALDSHPGIAENKWVTETLEESREDRAHWIPEGMRLKKEGVWLIYGDDIGKNWKEL